MTNIELINTLFVILGLLLFAHIGEFIGKCVRDGLKGMTVNNNVNIDERIITFIKEQLRKDAQKEI